MYPKWVSRGHGMGQILCRNEAEEAEVHKDNAARERPFAETVSSVVVTVEPVEAIPARKKPGPKPKVT